MSNIYMEVPFINGYTEFQEVLSKSIDVNEPRVTSQIKIELAERGFLPESLTYFNKNSDDVYATIKSVKEGDIWYLLIDTDRLNVELSLAVSYSFRNEEPKKMYSVDYNQGIIYFSEPTGRELKVSYQNDRVILTGKKAIQLDDTEYTYIDNRVNVFNFKENSSLSFVYTKRRTLTRNISPVIQDLKLNYITVDERSL